MNKIKKVFNRLFRFRKLDNKGMTLIELVICFVVVAIIVISLLNTIMNIKAKEQTEDIRKTVISYKNVITKVIQTDIIKNDLKAYTDKEPTSGANSTSNEEWVLNMEFNEPFCSDASGGVTKKELKIVRGNRENYIVYPDIVQNVDGICVSQNVKYKLETTTDVYDVDVSSSDKTGKTKYSDIRFAYVSVKTYGNIFTLDIPIYHSELGTKYHVKIVAPLNYLKSAKG